MSHPRTPSWIAALLVATLAIGQGCQNARNATPTLPGAPSPSAPTADTSSAPGDASPEPSVAPGAPASSIGPQAVAYDVDVQPLTANATCKACHQIGPGPVLALGTFSVDAGVDGATLLRMLSTYGGVTPAQLSRVDAWIAAGRPRTAPPPPSAGPVAGPSPTPRPGTPVPGSTASPTPAPGTSPSAVPLPTQTPAGGGNVPRYATAIQPLTGSATCKLCHTSGPGPVLALGTYAVDASVNAASLRRMLAVQGGATAAQLEQVDAWIAAGRPADGPAGTPAPAGPSSAPSASPPPATPTPAPGPTSAPSPGPTPTQRPASPTPRPSATPAPTPTPAASITYAAQVQPLTGSATCKLCHVSGPGPTLALGTYAVDASVNAASLRRMLAVRGGATAAQLAAIDAWIQAGRPLVVAPSSAPAGPTPMPGATATPPATASPTPRPSSSPAFVSPHASGWRQQHGDVVQAAGGYQYAKIGSGLSCTTCHSAVKLPDGSVPTSPGSRYTCYSCHAGPSGGD